MARRPAIEAEELFDAANRLQSEGKEVTAVALLDALGGGSLRTIYRHLEAWQRNRPTLINTAVVEIPAAVQAAFAAAWRVALLTESVGNFSVVAGVDAKSGHALSEMGNALAKPQLQSKWTSGSEVAISGSNKLQRSIPRRPQMITAIVLVALILAVIAGANSTLQQVLNDLTDGEITEATTEIIRNPSGWSGYYKRAQTELAQERFSEALADLNRTMEHSNGNPTIKLWVQADLDTLFKHRKSKSAPF
jgi:hypothetical protein